MTKARWACYMNGYSRSFGAECAEADGRLPLTRAAAALGLPAALVRSAAGVADLLPTEWHHVGRYATRVDYWDVPALRACAAFWVAAASAAGPRQKRRVRAACWAAVCHLAGARQERLAATVARWREQLTAPDVVRHSAAKEWRIRVLNSSISTKYLNGVAQFDYRHLRQLRGWAGVARLARAEREWRDHVGDLRAAEASGKAARVHRVRRAIWDRAAHMCRVGLTALLTD